MYSAADYGPGNMNDAGVDYGWESMVGSGGYSDAAGSSFGSADMWGGIFGLANTYLRTDAAVKMQQAQDGRRYIEGQPVVMSQQGGLTLSPGLLLLVGIGALAFLAAKD